MNTSSISVDIPNSESFREQGAFASRHPELMLEQNPKSSALIVDTRATLD